MSTTESFADAVVQLAKKTDRRSQFLQIEAEPGRVSRKRRKDKEPPKLTRVAFKVSRLMEFCTMRELQNQTGHHYTEWPRAALKELIDNSIDSCEESEIAPVISIAVKSG